MRTSKQNTYKKEKSKLLWNEHHEKKGQNLKKHKFDDTKEDLKKM